MNPVDEAQAMLNAFLAAAVEQFNITFVDQQGANRGHRYRRALAQITPTLPRILAQAEQEHWNVIIRPYSPSAIQLDDIPPEQFARLEPLSFMAVATSGKRRQLWLSVEGATDDIRRRLKEGTGADPNASGAVRLAGSRNYKPAYAPDYPQVSLISTNLGKTVTVNELAPFLAPPRPTWVARVGTSAMPDYRVVLAKAPKNHAGTAIDRSWVDWHFAQAALASGANRDEVIVSLMANSAKAKERQHGVRYCRNTVDRAAESLRKH